MENVTLKTRVSERIEAWKKEIEQLRKQLQHNREEAKESFENQKEKLANWADDMKDEIERVEGIGEDKLKELKGKLENLRLQAALGKMESVDAMNDQQKKINEGIHNVRGTMSKMENEVAENVKSLLEKSNQTLDRFQNQFEMSRLQLLDTREGVVQTWKDRQEEISLRLQKLNDKLEEGRNDASERWEDFSSEMQEAWVHYKNALKV